MAKFSTRRQQREGKKDGEVRLDPVEKKLLAEYERKQWEQRMAVPLPSRR